MSKYQLAELNVAELKAPLDSPQLKDFVDNLDRINALAEGSPGFIWRLKGDGNDATGLRPMGDRIIVNLSVWKDAETLRHWIRNLDDNLERAEELAGPERLRVWRLYLRAARNGFEIDFTSVYQVLCRLGEA